MTTTTYLKTRQASLATPGSPPVAGFSIPVTSGLLGAYMQSGGTDWARFNFATMQNDATLRGSPQNVDRFIRFGVGAGVETPVLETPAATMFLIGRKDPSNPAFFVGCRVAASDAGVAVFAPAANMQLSVQTAGGEVVTNLAINNNWNMWIARVPGTGGGYRLQNLTTGGNVVSPSTANRVVTTVSPYLVGDLPGTWSADMLCALIFDRVLTDAETEALGAWGRAYAADFGVTV